MNKKIIFRPRKPRHFHAVNIMHKTPAVILNYEASVQRPILYLRNVKLWTATRVSNECTTCPEKKPNCFFCYNYFLL